MNNDKSFMYRQNTSPFSYKIKCDAGNNTPEVIEQSRIELVVLLYERSNIKLRVDLSDWLLVNAERLGLEGQLIDERVWGYARNKVNEIMMCFDYEDLEMSTMSKDKAPAFMTIFNDYSEAS